MHCAVDVVMMNQNHLDA